MLRVISAMRVLVDFSRFQTATAFLCFLCICLFIDFFFTLSESLCTYTFLHMNVSTCVMAQKQVSEDNLRHHSSHITFFDTGFLCYSTDVYSCLDSIRDSRFSTNSL